MAEVTSCLSFQHMMPVLLYFCLKCLLESATLAVMEVLVQQHRADLKGHKADPKGRDGECAFSS